MLHVCAARDGGAYAHGHVCDPLYADVRVCDSHNVRVCDFPDVGVCDSRDDGACVPADVRVCALLGERDDACAGVPHHGHVDEPPGVRVCALRYDPPCVGVRVCGGETQGVRVCAPLDERVYGRVRDSVGAPLCAHVCALRGDHVCVRVRGGVGAVVGARVCDSARVRDRGGDGVFRFPCECGDDGVRCGGGVRDDDGARCGGCVYGGGGARRRVCALRGVRVGIDDDDRDCDDDHAHVCDRFGGYESVGGCCRVCDREYVARCGSRRECDGDLDSDHVCGGDSLGDDDHGYDFDDSCDHVHGCSHNRSTCNPYL